MLVKLAPEADGFTSDFFQSYWTIIGLDAVREIQDFFRSGKFPPKLNVTHIRLIPKVLSPKKVSDYRPIALCYVFYKIVAKILTKRLQAILPEIILEHQSAFVPGRAISDNVLITHETLHFLRSSQAKKHGEMVVKMDMSKAYDRIEWDFLKAVLVRMGFHDICICWILECVSTVSYTFLINGSPQGNVIPTRGFRQGDPLYPYLFVLCTEVLSDLCHQAQMNGTLPEVMVAKESPYVNISFLPTIRCSFVSQIRLFVEH